MANPFNGVPYVCVEDESAGVVMPALATSYDGDEHTLPIVRSCRLSADSLTLPTVKAMLGAAIAAE